MYLKELRAFLGRYAPVAAAGVLLALSGNVLAQDADLVIDAIEDAEEDGTAEPRDMDEITVTGSRIKRTEFNTTAPIQVITSERSQLAGLLDTADILQSSTVASGQQINNSFSGFVTDGGPGANTISLRGLGAQRTLVLVNSKRWGPSGVRGSINSVDLSAIPSSQVARFEIFKDGASSVYGADAVAGVVNAITRKRIDGSALNAQVFTPERGGSAYSIDGIWGRTGDNWSFNISAAYGERQETVRNDLPYGHCDQRPRVDGSNTDPNGDPYCFGFQYGLHIGPGGLARYEPSLTDPNDTSNPYYDPLFQGQFGMQFWTGAPLNDDPGQGPWYRDTLDGTIAHVAPKGTSISVNSFGDFDFSLGSRAATAYYEFFYNQRETQSNSGYRQFFPVVGPDNPTSPWAPFGGAFTQVVLPSYNMQDPMQETIIERTNTFLGLKGDISETWTYDFYVGHSWSEGTYEEDNWLNGQVNASLDSEIDGGGDLVCSAAALADYPDCVPADLYTGDAMLRGILPQDVLNFIGKRTLGNTEYNQVQAAGYITGELFEIGGDRAVSAVFGLEFRNEEINDVPDQEAQDDNVWGSTTAGITAGDYDVSEVFTEFEIPILRDSPLGKEMTLNASWRYTDYSTYGGDDTYRLGFNWQITDLFRVRATTGTSFRAPDLFEQFLGNETGFLPALGRDICVDYGSNYDPATNVYQNCAADGLAPDFGTTGGLPSIRTVTGGNEDLLAETSDSWTAGIVLTPDALNTSMAISVFDIELNNTVASPSVAFIVSDCYNSDNKSGPFCSRIEPRDIQGFLTDVDSSLLNVGAQRSRGIDYNVLYQKDYASFDLSIDITATQLLEQDRELFGVTTDYFDKWAYAEWAAQADIRIDYRDFTFFYSLNYFGSSAEDPVDNRYCGTDPITYNNASVRYRGQNDWEIIGTVRNIFDEMPPIVSDGCASATANRFFNTLPGAGYDLLGRSYALQLSKGFDF